MFRTLTLALIVCIMSYAMAGRACSDQPDTSATEETERFVQGFVRFMAYHEAGHLLMQQLEGLHSDPDWTQQDLEAYADQFAMVLMEPDSGDEDGISEIISASLGWLQVNKGIAPNDPHAPPHERAMDIICLMYGSDTQGFSQFREYTRPEDNCAERYNSIEQQVETVFRNHSEEQGFEIDIILDEPASDMVPAREFLDATGLLYDLKDDIEADFFLTDRTTIRSTNCTGRAEPNQFYFDTHRGETVDDDHYVITICYELIAKRLNYGTQGLD